ncbi:hypothetical protein M422DRAFT_251596 [Sphaerobolus stellatus SS14]|uniref:Uncharacterized protein n=1 Tax=Sphaerobolus stellatus (strain SS14) TaxID=990650 RepID=A0A0C9UQ11_SPHS4|nr:hypothetical protein M422DRAFT_251596 [Sphaerobolus stellatus SS14]
MVAENRIGACILGWAIGNIRRYVLTARYARPNTNQTFDLVSYSSNVGQQEGFRELAGGSLWTHLLEYTSCGKQIPAFPENLPISTKYLFEDIKEACNALPRSPLPDDPDSWQNAAAFSYVGDSR